MNTITVGERDVRLIQKILEAGNPDLAEEIEQASQKAQSGLPELTTSSQLQLHCTDGLLERIWQSLKDETLDQWPAENLEPEDYERLIQSVEVWMVQWSRDDVAVPAGA